MGYSDEHFFETFGPLEIPVEGRSIAAPGKAWWDEVDDRAGYELSGAIGCYLFTLGRERIRPWYVGKTVNQDGFCAETFTDHKLGCYNWALKPTRKSRRRGPASLFLFPLVTRPFEEEWAFATGHSHSPYIEWLERTLIGMAFARNPDIANYRDTMFLQTVHVRGVMGSKTLGRRKVAVERVRCALFGREKVDTGGPQSGSTDEH